MNAEPTPPTNADAERSLLGSVVADPSNFDRVADVFSSRDFADDALRQAYDAVEALWRCGQVVNDSKLLPSLMRHTKAWEALGGAEGVARLFSHVGASSHAIYYAKEVSRCAGLRRQIKLAEELLRRASDPKGDPSDVRMFAEAQFAAFESPHDSPVRSVGAIASESVRQIAADLETSRRPGVMTGLYTFDSTIGSLMCGELALLAARPSVGKTALGLQIGEHVATRGRRVLVVSLEMRDRELVDRMLAKHSGVNGRRIRSRKLDAADLSRLRGAAGSMGEMPLQVWSPPRATASQIRAVAKLEQSRGGLDFVVVDYVGLIRSGRVVKDARERVSDAGAAMKALAKELDVPVLCLAQLNREAETQRPGLQNLAESGTLEADADMVMFLHKQRREDADADLIVAKNRNGEIGEMRLNWHKESTQFTDPLAPTREGAFDEWNG